jgi:hypothetical protein
LAISAKRILELVCVLVGGLLQRLAARHDDGLQSASDAPVAEICLAPRSADSYSASGDGAEPGEITALKT